MQQGFAMSHSIQPLRRRPFTSTPHALQASLAQLRHAVQPPHPAVTQTRTFSATDSERALNILKKSRGEPCFMKEGTRPHLCVGGGEGRGEERGEERGRRGGGDVQRSRGWV